MLTYLGKRLLFTLPTFILVAVAVFVLVRLIPGDPVQVMLGDAVDPSLAQTYRSELGLDHPLPVQFFYWLGRVMQGDFGHSIANGAAVMPLILHRFMVSASIVLMAVLLATMIAVPAGLLAAWRQNRSLDTWIVSVATVLLSIPSFWLGLLLLILFGLTLGWLPVVGYVGLQDNLGQALLYMVLPVMTLTFTESGILTRMMRASSIEVLRLEYVTHARAKGLSERTVLLRHVLPNAFAPTWTMIGLILGHLLGGIAVIETVFTIPGLGRLLVDSIYARDYPVVQGCLLFTAVIYVVINLIVDFCYPLFDPRVLAQ